MANEIYDDSLGRRTSRETKSGEDVASAQDTERLQSAAGLGSRQKGGALSAGKKPMPKQSDYSTLGEFGTAMRNWRNEQDSEPENQAQKRAIKAMSK